MNDDDLLRKLAQISRQAAHAEHARLDRRWDALSAGELTGEDERALQAMAASSTVHAQALDAFYPLDEGFRQRMVSLLAAATETPKTSTILRPRWSWRGLLWELRRLWLLPAGAMAALLLMVLLLPTGGPGSLPDYQAELSGGIELQRGPQQEIETPILAPGSSLTLVLRPQSAVADELEVRSLLVQQDTVLEPSLPTEIAASGAVRIKAELGDSLDLGPGVWSLIVTVAQQGCGPTLEELRGMTDAAQLRGEHWVAHRVSFKVITE